MSFKDKVISWNSKFPFDRRWRKKHQISFNSNRHREANQVDIYFDVFEDEILGSFADQISTNQKNLEKYRESGTFIDEFRSSLSQEEEDSLYENLTSDKLNNYGKKPSDE